MDKMKVTHFLGTMRSGHDGVTRFAFQIRENFDKSKAKHHFVAPVTDNPAPCDITRILSVPFPLSTGYRYALTSVRLLRKALPWIPDVFHVHSFCPLSVTASKLALKEKRPLIATFHTNIASYMRYYHTPFMAKPLWRHLKRLYRRCHIVIVPSPSMAELLDKQGLHNWVIIPHGVNTTSFSPKHRSEEWREKVGGKGKIIFTFTGRLVMEKNPHLVADAYRLMKHKDRVKVVFVGGGPAQPKIQKKIPEATFLGQVPESEVPIADASSDVFVFPSVTETFGNVTVEAMASGLPAICASTGGARDIVEPGKNGFLIQKESAAELAGYMDRMVEDPQMRARFSKHAIHTALKFNWEVTARKHESLYEGLLQAGTEAVPNLELLSQPHLPPALGKLTRRA